MPLVRLTVVPLAVVMCACGVDPSDVAKGRAELKAATSCREVEEQIRANALAEVNAELYRQEKAAMDRPLCLVPGGFTFDRTAPMTLAAGVSENSATDGTAPPAPGASQYSETNNQVAGVDEPDFLKNDGKYLYVLAGKALKIFDAFPPEQAHLVGQLDFAGTPSKLLVHAGRAAVYVREKGQADTRPCTYGYDCEFRPEPGPLAIAVVDLSDVTAPKLVKELRTGGGFLAARRVGSAVHTIVSYGDARIEGLTTQVPGSFECGPQDLFRGTWLPKRFNEAREKNREAVMAADVSVMVPKLTERLPDGTERQLNGDADCGQFYLSQQGDGRTVVSLISFDLAGTQDASVATIVGRPGAVYSDGASMFLASRHQGAKQGFFGTLDSTSATTVHRFALGAEPPSAKYAGSGAVKGHLLNQFSMDAYQGHLRLATSSGHVPDPDVHSTLTVLEIGDTALTEVGRVDKLAPGEDIRSARFMGDRGFVVTFKKTDPLFAFDLRDPKAPKLVGELKIPGFSTYLHPVDENHLIGLGYDAEDHGSFAFFQGVLLQMFDVSDLAAPKLVHRYVIGTRGSTSDATTDHLAFTYFKPKGVVGLPMTVCDGSSGGSSYGKMTFSGLMLFGVSTQTGFEYQGGVAHAEPEATAGSFCSNWWTNSNSHVKRSVFMDDVVYSVAPDAIHVQRLGALGTDVTVLPLNDAL